MERLASRQHLGRIIESLEKTGAPEPLSCVNVALQILSAVCTDCLDCIERAEKKKRSDRKHRHTTGSCVRFRCRPLVHVFERSLLFFVSAAERKEVVDLVFIIISQSNPDMSHVPEAEMNFFFFPFYSEP